MTALVSVLALPVPAEGVAQIRASERSTVSQTVDGTRITIDYSRPHVRGRDSLFGGVVPWGKEWTGANWATTIEVNRDVTIDGHALAAGKYSIWFVVQPEEWTVIFDPQPLRFHLFPPQPSEDQLRFAVRPVSQAQSELLTWGFPSVRPTGATLRFEWGTTGIVFDIGVPPSRPVTVAADVARRHVGSYRLALKPPLGNDVVPYEIRYDGEHLVATWESAPNPNLKETWLVSLGEGMFAVAELKDGELFDVVMDLVLEFTPLDRQATGFEVRALGDELWATAERER